MGGAQIPPSSLGQQMNEEFFTKFAQARERKNLMRQQQNDEMFATLAKSGQRPYDPYRSPY